MALPGTGFFSNLIDAARSMDPQGKTDTVVELLNQTNEILDDMPWQEGNLPTGHLLTVRTGLPAVIWRKMYQGVPAGKSMRQQVTDTVGMLTARSEVDKKIADMNGNTKAFRLSEATAFLESMNQQMATTLFYGDTDVNPERFTGLSARYNTVSTAKAANAINCIDMGGTSSVNTSIWLLSWGPQTLFGLFPKGSKAGIVHQDLGEIDCFDPNGDRYRGYADTFEWDCGISLRDWRYCVRICNIDTAKLIAGTINFNDVITPMIKAIHRLPNIGIVGAPPSKGIPMAGRPVFYCNRVVYEMLDIESLNKTQYTLKSGTDVFGRPVTFCRGIPIKCVDAILNTEGQVV